MYKTYECSRNSRKSWYLPVVINNIIQLRVLAFYKWKIITTQSVAVCFLVSNIQTNVNRNTVFAVLNSWNRIVLFDLPFRFAWLLRYGIGERWIMNWTGLFDAQRSILFAIGCITFFTRSMIFNSVYAIYLNRN